MISVTGAPRDHPGGQVRDDVVALAAKRSAWLSVTSSGLAGDAVTARVTDRGTDSRTASSTFAVGSTRTGPSPGDVAPRRSVCCE